MNSKGFIRILTTVTVTVTVQIQILLLTHLLLVKESWSEIVLNPHVEISTGVLVGETGRSLSGREFHKFWCVPYGKQKRFEPSEPADPWSGPFDATLCDVTCPQTDIIPGMGDVMQVMESTEDCLVLNVFVPKNLNSSSPLPVMFYIHGGYFLIGSSLMYSGETLLDENIILITINYRLGAFGFLTTNDGQIDANLGLKDVVVALKWVQTNIHYFGGDPKRVTIFGESAGAGAVSFLVLSPSTKGLFQHAISQSGGPLSAWSLQSKPEQVFEEFVKGINCSRDTTEEAVACLKTKTPSEITSNQATKWFMEVLYPTFPAVETFPPKKSQIFLPAHPLKMLKEGNFNRVPYISGVCEDEGAYQGGFTMNDEELLASLNYGWLPNSGIALGMDTRNITLPKLNAGLRKLRQFYFGNEDISQKHVYNLTDMFSDGWFLNSFGPVVKYYSKHAPIYPYIFAKKGELHVSNFFKHFDRQMTSHADDLMYLFFKAFSTEEDKIFAKNFAKLWVSFAYAGKPVATWGSAKVWPYVKPAPEAGDYDYKLYVLNEDTKLVDNPFKARFQLWQDLADNEWNELRD